MGNVLKFPSREPSIPIEKRNMKLTCLDCGNQKHFHGRAATQPFIVIKQSAEYQYEINEVGYVNNGTVEEWVESCGMCGNTKIAIETKEDS